MFVKIDGGKVQIVWPEVEDLINDYETLMKLREEIQAKYFSFYEELLKEDLIEGELDANIWGITIPNHVEAVAGCDACVIRHGNNFMNAAGKDDEAFS